MVDVRGRWRVVSVGGRAADGEAELTFDADGGVAGRPGVNRVRAAFTLDGAELTCAPFVTTRMAGPPELMAQEQTVLEVLTGPSTVTADGDRVVIGAGVTQLVLTSAPG